MMFVVKKNTTFQNKLSAHGLENRNMNQPYLPTGNLSCFQADISYSAMRIFNTAHNHMKSLKNDRVQFNCTM
jgi:hypothetical protein